MGIRSSLLPEIRSFGLGQLLRKSKSNIWSGGEIAARAVIRASLKPTGRAKPAPAEIEADSEALGLWEADILLDVLADKLADSEALGL